METAQYWQALFEKWPEVIKRQGAVVTREGEAVPFVNFLISGGLLLLERDGPDANGARRVIIAYDAIGMVKLSTTAEMSLFQAMGFQPVQ